LIIFTSGTTGKPKAALHTHASLAAQCAALCEAWAWTAKDRIYHCLPLHHVHGIVNAWLCAAVAGATCEFHDAFSPTALWSRFESDPAVEPPITIFMGVPTMYHRMVQAWDQRRKMESGGVNETLISARSWSQACAKSLRLAVSGSAALSAAVAKRWREVSAPGMITTGVIPLERYGMTEIGMALSNPLEPAAERELSRVGAPLPGVDVRVAEERELEEEKQAEKEETVKALKNAARGSGSLPARGKKRDAGKGKEEGVSAAGGAGGAGAAGAATGAAGAAKWSLDPTPRLPDTLSLRLETSGASAKEVVIARGELRVRGPGVFARYVNRPEATARCFDKLGYFKTGDVVEASRSGVGPAPDRVTYRVLGRMSADIIKRGGYKLSALEIEEALMEINGVGEAAVLGLPDEAYGETLAAVMTLTQPTLLFEPGYYDSRETMSKTARAIVKAAQKLAEYKIPALWRVVPRIPRNAMGKVNKRKLASLFDAAFDGFEFTPVKERVVQGDKLYEFANDADPGVMKLSKQQGYKYFHRMPWGHRANDGGTDLLRLECDRCRSGKDPRTRIRETYYISKDGWCEKETQIEPR
jgi:malonyl-CoA/methylmalonyl-CoA synthetase